VVGHLAGAASHRRTYAEGLEVIGEGLAIEPLRHRPVDDLVIRVEPAPLLVQGPEYGQADLLFLAHRQEGVVELLVLALLEGHMHPTKDDVVGQLRDPAPQDRLEPVAMGTAIPEELDDIDLAGGHVGRHRSFDPAIALALGRQGGLRMRRWQFDAGETRQDDRRRQGDQVATEGNHRAILSIGVLGPIQKTTEGLAWLTAALTAASP